MKDNTKIETYTTKINNKIAIDKICFFLEILGLKDLVINKSKKISPKLLNNDSIILNLLSYNMLHYITSTIICVFYYEHLTI